MFFSRSMRHRLLKSLPNTYAYTKALTEDLVNSYAGRLPIVITRPSIGMCRMYMCACVCVTRNTHKSMLIYRLFFISDASLCV